MTLYQYLIENGVDEKTAKTNVEFWEWDIPRTSNKIDTLCWRWWNEVTKEKKNG